MCGWWGNYWHHYCLSACARRNECYLAGGRSVLNGTTGHTTAKVTAQHGIIYDELIGHVGKEKATLYYQANQDALHFIKDMVNRKRISCDYNEQDAIIYAANEQDDQKLMKEWEAYQKLGIDSDLLTEIPLNLPIQSAITMKNQGQFHPLQYLSVLVNELVEKGAEIFEHTVATDVVESNGLQVVTKNGSKVSCDHLVIASHFPFTMAWGSFLQECMPRDLTFGSKNRKTTTRGNVL